LQLLAEEFPRSKVAPSPGDLLAGIIKRSLKGRTAMKRSDYLRYTFGIAVIAAVAVMSFLKK